MIARVWRGTARADNAAAYASYIQETGIGGYNKTPSNRAWVLWRAEGDRGEFITVISWESRRVIHGLAGQDIENAA